MEEFDFNAPISAMIIYDEEYTEEEAVNIKPSPQDLVETAKITENELPIISKVQENPENETKSRLPTPIINVPQKIESTVKNLELDFESRKQGSCKQGNTETNSAHMNSVLLPKPLDMPSLEDESMNSENITQINIISSVSEKLTNNGVLIDTEVVKKNHMLHKHYKMNTHSEKEKSISIQSTEHHQNPKRKTETLGDAEYAIQRKRKITKSKKTSGKKLANELSNADKTPNKDKDISKRILTDSPNNIGDTVRRKPSIKNKKNPETKKNPENVICEKQNKSNLISRDDQLSSLKPTQTFNSSDNIVSSKEISKDLNQEKQVSCETVNNANNFGHCNQPSSNIDVTVLDIDISPTLQTLNRPIPFGNSLSRPQNDTPGTVNDYLKDLLNTVSEHMIYVMSSYQSYARLHPSNTDPRLIEMAKNNYIRTKNHFFDLSYSSVMNIIIPRKDDPTFVKKFLENTVHIAQSKSMNYSYCEFLESLYLDMIKWVQKRHEQIQNMNINAIHNPFLVNELQKPTKLPYRQDKQINKQWSQSSCRTSMQTRYTNKIAHSQEPSMRLQPELVEKQLQNPILHNKPAPPYQNQSQHLIQGSPMRHSYFSPSTGGSELNAQPLYLNERNTQGSSNQNEMYTQSTPYSLLKTNHPLHDMQRVIIGLPFYNGANAQTASIHRHSNPPCQNNETVEKQKQSSLNMQNHVILSHTHSFLQSQKDQYLEKDLQNNQRLRSESSTQADPNRSSISRDSGFMSPLNFNNNNDLSVQEGTELNTTPLITHVTSLNPNASLIQDGSCAICGKITKQKCLGCFKIYYCSHKCQFLDWNTHQFECK